MHKKILDHLNSVIMLFNHAMKLTYINNAGEILFADSARHLEGMPVENLFKNANEAIIEDLRHCLTSNEVLVDRELSLEFPKQLITANLSATPLLEGGIVSDVIVELQPVDRHLRISQGEKLLEQQHSARMLVRGLAHEIKNPLGGIRGAAQLLDMELQDAELSEYTRIIIAESDRLRELVDRMLGPNKLPHKTDLNIHEVLERVRQLVLAETTGQIAIKQDYDPSIPMLKADLDQLIQAVLNIVRNAVQALDNQGVITLKTRINRQATINHRRYRLSIKIDIIDHGPGIKKNMINQIFYPLISDRTEGTGLGLPIAQSLINQHNGIIECSSEPGYTVFSIHLPVENSDEHT